MMVWGLPTVWVAFVAFSVALEVFAHWRRGAHRRAMEGLLADIRRENERLEGMVGQTMVELGISSFEVLERMADKEN